MNKLCPETAVPCKSFPAIITALALISISFSAESAQAPLTLGDCYAKALAKSESLAQQGELSKQAGEKMYQVVGGLLPSVSAGASYIREDKSDGFDGKPVPDKPTVKLTASQPLFRGGREYFGVRQAGKLADAQKAAEKQSAISLFRDLAQGFYAVVSAEQDLVELDKELEAFDGRIKELQSRESLGRSRTSEILSAQSARASLLAQKEQVKGQLAVARETLSFLTGLDAGIGLADTAASATIIEPQENYLSGISDRPDLISAKAKSEAAQAGLWVARCAMLPSLDLVGNYYPVRTGVSQDIKWDAQIALTMPLFTGGINLSRVREASSIDRQGRLEVSRVERSAEQDIRVMYSRVAADLAQVDALAQATSLADRNYQEQTSDYRLGLVTNLEVTQALANSQDTRRSFNRAVYALKADWAVLDAASARRKPPSGGAK